jgi:hypothetical protein
MNDEGDPMNTLFAPEFKTSAPLPHAPLKRSPLQPAAVLAAPLLGTWINGNGAVRDLLKVVVTMRSGTLIVEAFSSLNDESCEWGPVTAIAYTSSVSSAPAVAFTAQYTFRQSHVILIGHLHGKRLLVETFTQITDGSGRPNLYSVDTLSR